MNTSKILTIVFVLLVLGSVGAVYYRYMVQKDFLVKYETPCEPSEEACFVYECDPEIEECTGNPEEDIAYYSLMYRKAYNVPECDVEIEGDCDAAYVCPKAEEGCEIVTCTEEIALSEEVSCSDPKDFPVEMEEVEEEAIEEESAIPEPRVLEVPAVAPVVVPSTPIQVPAGTSPAAPVASPTAL
jgi:hypothetical protein